MISCTGKGIRNDRKGMGGYGTSRGNRTHRGTDYKCDPGQDIVAPIAGKVVREAYPYEDRKYSGLIIQGSDMCVKLLYLEPNAGIIGKIVKQGDIIGKAQDISKRKPSYVGMRPHIHQQILSLNPHVLVSKL